MKEGGSFFSLGKSRKQRERSLAILIAPVVLALAFGCLHLIVYVHLIFRYGWEEVQSKNLHFTSLKPRFVVSNGDVLSTWESLLDAAILFILMAILMVFVVVPLFNRVVSRKLP